MPTRNVNLTEELDRFVLSKIESGRYENASEVVRAALRTLEREEQEHEAKLAALRAAIDEGDTSGIAGSDVFSRVRKTLNFQPHGAKEDLERFGENQLPDQCTRRPLKRPLDVGGNPTAIEIAGLRPYFLFIYPTLIHHAGIERKVVFQGEVGRRRSGAVCHVGCQRSDISSARSRWI